MANYTYTDDFNTVANFDAVDLEQAVKMGRQIAGDVCTQKRTNFLWGVAETDLILSDDPLAYFDKTRAVQTPIPCAWENGFVVMPTAEEILA